MKTVAVGLSGGVDSTVSAYLLKSQGYHVIGLFMKNWDDEKCPLEQDYLDVVSVCNQIGIDHYTLNFTQEYWDQVFTMFLEELQSGRTPNPDVLCNKNIKFKLMLAKALELGADYLATGHYAKISMIKGEPALLKPKDNHKDQTYFLCHMPKESLKKVIFPLADLTKDEVRAIAKQQNFANAKKKDSTGICFIGKRPFSEFIEKYLQDAPGKMVTKEGLVVGTHRGLHHYTIGQRKGLKIGGPGEAWFVVDKKPKTNTLIVAQGSDHQELYIKMLTASHPTWLRLTPNCDTTALRVNAKIRYRQKEAPCTIRRENQKLVITFDEPQRAVTVGQSIVFYQDEECLGGATIDSTNPLSNSSLTDKVHQNLMTTT